MPPLATILHIAMPVLWLAWIGYWSLSARNVKRPRWREPAAGALLHDIPFLICALLLAVPRWWPFPLTARMFGRGPGAPLFGALLLAAGLGFAVWARVHLGRNWSSRVEIKEDHALVRSGPYRLVRHPIYTGLLLALAGTALAIGEWRGALAVAFALLGCLIKMRTEEREMRRLFPEYESYRAHTAALIPFLL